MNDIKHSLIFLLVGLVLGGIIGFFLGHSSAGLVEPGVTVERDTTSRTDTLPDYTPAPTDSGLVRWMVIRVPVESSKPAQSTGAADHAEPVIVTNTIHDTVEVELPVTQKRYQTDTYQAWVSGYRPQLDSIEVYQKTQTITETITITEKSKTKHWGIGFTGGYGYDFNSKTAAPFVGVGVSYNLISF